MSFVSSFFDSSRSRRHVQRDCSPKRRLICSISHSKDDANLYNFVVGSLKNGLNFQFVNEKTRNSVVIL